MKGNEPAYPQTVTKELMELATGQWDAGLTKREYFAGEAAKTIPHKPYQWDNNYNSSWNNVCWDEQLLDQAKLAVRKADALIKVLEDSDDQQR